MADTEGHPAGPAVNPLGLVTEAVLADWLGITARSLARQRADDRAPGALAIRIGRAWYYRMGDLDGWVAQVPTAREARGGSE